MQLTSQQVHAHFSYKEFIPFLAAFLKKDVRAPDRSHFGIPVSGKSDATLLLMPAWAVDDFIGVKIVSVFPENKRIPTINGTYLLIDGQTGVVLCTIDGLALTIKRTAAVSGLAASFLAPDNARSLLMIGTGNLCHELIRAHASVRPLQKAWIWGRHFDKAKAKATSLDLEGMKVEAIENKALIIPTVDIISCATLSHDPLVPGRLLGEHTYLDLVGSFQKESREADDACLSGANIYVDTYNALAESGDLYIPLENKVIKRSDIRSDLSSLCRNGDLNEDLGKKRNVFKSVGFASPDLAAAVYLYRKINGHGGF